MTPSADRETAMRRSGAPHWRFARAIKATLGRLLLAIYRVDLTGWERVPTGGAILAGNHVSYLDPALLWSAARRPVHFVAKIELWEPRLLGWALDHLWAFPVKRGSADREMISAATGLLESGELVGMFPEGTRKRDSDTDELGAAHGGVAFLAIRAGVPVVPVGIAGTEEALPAGAKMPRFPRVTIVVGQPIDPSGFEGGRKERTEAMTAAIMDAIAEARGRARGV